jgi:ribonuclease Z
MLAATDPAAGEPATLLVDCGGDVLQRLLESGTSLDSIAGLIVTHAHPDHTAGFPLFMEKIWLSGRERPLPVCGIEPALEQVRRTWDAFEPVHRGWDAPEIDWRPVPHEPGATAWDDPRWHVSAAPVDHGDMPNVGLRFEHRATGRVAAYSCDTARSPAVVDLAANADLLVHEANGDFEGHSTAEDAAAVAEAAGARRLVLVHLPAGDKSPSLKAARTRFSATELGDELGAYPF